ncbi:hypothetical protein HS041_30205 [Planomonospora sp. ID67723]|nr:hypothetical protein [Planomonospora sp. ID67723]
MAVVLSLTTTGVLAAVPEASAVSADSRRAVPSAGPLGGCPNTPANSFWHADVSGLPRHPNSRAYVSSIGTAKKVKADFGSGLWEGGPIGIPITYVKAGQAKVPVSFEYGDESDRGPYPVPRNARIEGGPSSQGDRHVLVVDTGSCTLYELYAAHPRGRGWRAGSGAVFDLRSNKLRPAGWTSADAAGLPIAPGLVRYEEVAAGRIDHAIRVTVPRSQKKYVWPARHFASSSTDAALPPMGLRLRLRAGVDTSRLPRQARVIAEAMKTYGVIVADNGSSWFISGTPDNRWDNDQLRMLGTLKGADFEAVDSSSLMISPASAAARSR